MLITIPSDSTKFRTALIPGFIFLFGLGVIGLLIYVIAKDGWNFNRHALAFAIGFQVVFALVMSWMLSLLFPIAFSVNGVYAHSFWGNRRFIAWQDVASARTLQLLNLRWLRIYSTDGKVTWLAMFQSRGSAFRQEIRRLAPADSPILRCF
jgi:hypothetical protein